MSDDAALRSRCQSTDSAASEFGDSSGFGLELRLPLLLLPGRDAVRFGGGTLLRFDKIELLEEEWMCSF